MDTGSDERTLGTLVSDLTQQMSSLVQQEMQLARAEMSQQVGRISGGVRSLVIGAAFAFTGLTLILVAAVLGLAVVVPAWFAALLVGVVAANIGSLVMLHGRRRLNAVDLMPSRALRSITRRVQDGAASTRRVA